MLRIAFALGLVLLLAPPALATVIEVPVPELAGTRSCAPLSDSSCFQRVVVHLPAVPAVIRSVSLSVVGTTTFAAFQCSPSGPVFSPPTTIAASLHEPGAGVGDSWTARHTNGAPGPMVFVEPFERLTGTWAFLLDGTAELQLFVDATGPIDDCNLAGPRDSTTLDRVTLVIDGDFPTPIARTSWGRLKSIYR